MCKEVQRVKGKGFKRGEEDEQPGRYLQRYSPESRVSRRGKWRAVQGSEKEVGEEPPHYLSELLLNSNTPHAVQAHVRPNTIQEYR